MGFFTTKPSHVARGGVCEGVLGVKRREEPEEVRPLNQQRWFNGENTTRPAEDRGVKPCSRHEQDCPFSDSESLTLLLRTVQTVPDRLEAGFGVIHAKCACVRTYLTKHLVMETELCGVVSESWFCTEHSGSCCCLGHSWFNNKMFLTSALCFMFHAVFIRICCLSPIFTFTGSADVNNNTGVSVALPACS